MARTQTDWPALKLEYVNSAMSLRELDPKYCDVIIKRWQDFTGKQAIDAETGEPFDASR